MQKNYLKRNRSFNAKTFLKSLTGQPGVYCIYGELDTVIYVGKAKNLKKRLSSYFKGKGLVKKTAKLVEQIHHIEVTVTNTEKEALILEHNYIKKHLPKYNVLLRDDKSYPYIVLTNDEYPRVALYRGKKQKDNKYYGPYPSVTNARSTLSLMQKLFPVRQCENSFYRNRTRPCLQYQIKRCLGPCVAGLVTKEEYWQQVECVDLFLSGKSEIVVNHLVSQMEAASQQLLFEKAADYRDQIQSIRNITETQSVVGLNSELDVIGLEQQADLVCIHILFIRQNQVFDSYSYFPQVPQDTNKEEILQTFVGQFYLQESNIHYLPAEIILASPISDASLLEELLQEKTGRKTKIYWKCRGERAQYVHLAQTNARSALQMQKIQRSSRYLQLQDLATFLGKDKILRIECFDISHTMGEHIIASCVVFGELGPLFSDYRRYNIMNITPGDDYAAMQQVVDRRYNHKRLTADKIPDVIFIDGGKGQLRRAIDTFNTLDVTWDKTQTKLIGIAKGSARKTGLETLYLSYDHAGTYLEANSPVLHIIQQVRDEAHRYAISGHRRKRGKESLKSIIGEIEGIGAKRKQALLKYLGGWQQLKSATAEEIAKVPGISLKMAQKIINSLKE